MKKIILLVLMVSATSNVLGGEKPPTPESISNSLRQKHKEADEALKEINQRANEALKRNHEEADKAFKEIKQRANDSLKRNHEEADKALKEINHRANDALRKQI